MAILIGAACFSLALKELEGDEIIRDNLMALPFGSYGVIICVLLLIFLMGFFLDWIEITLVLIPIVAPLIGAMELGMNAGGLEDIQLIWFGILVAMTLQTSFPHSPRWVCTFLPQGSYSTGD